MRAPLLSTLLVCVYVCVCVYGAQVRYDWVEVKVNGTKPEARYHHGAAGNNGEHIVVVGGFDTVGEQGVYLNDTWLFHIRNNTWRYVNSSAWTNLTNRAYFTANTYRYEVIVFGGQGPNGTVFGDVWRFREFEWHQDIYNGNITNQTRALVNRQYHASAIVGDTLFVFGGKSGYYGNNTNELFAYNLTSNNWTLLGSGGPPARQGHTLHAWRDPVYGESLITFGGYSDAPFNSGFNDAWQYVIRDRKWYSFNSFGAPDGRSGHSGAIINNTLYIYGGYSFYKPPVTDMYYGDTWSLVLNGGGASKWVQITDDSANGINRRQGHQIVHVNNTLYSTGGYVQYVGMDNNVWSFVNV